MPLDHLTPFPVHEPVQSVTIMRAFWVGGIVAFVAVLAGCTGGSHAVNQSRAQVPDAVQAIVDRTVAYAALTNTWPGTPQDLVRTAPENSSDSIQAVVDAFDRLHFSRAGSTFAIDYVLSRSASGAWGDVAISCNPPLSNAAVVHVNTTSALPAEVIIALPTGCGLR